MRRFAPGATVIITALAFLAITPVRARAADPAGQPEWMPGEVIVAYRRAPASVDLDRLRQRLPGIQSWRAPHHPPAARRTIRQEHPLARVRVVQIAPDADVQATARRISRIPGVAYAHPNYLIQPAFVPNDPLLQNETQYGPQIIRAPEAWDTTTGDPNIIIAVADAGLYFPHEDLQDAIWTNDGEFQPPDFGPDGIDADGNGFVDDWRGWNFMTNSFIISDADAHGTHVAGILAARLNNGRGMAGVCQCKIMVLQIFDRNQSGQLVGTWEALANAIYYAVDNGARAMNISAAGRGTDEEISVVSQAVQYAWNNDMSVVVAMGNVPSTSLYPALLPETIAVGATTEQDVIWRQSSLTGSGTGPHIDVCAPGADVISTWNNGTSRYGFLTGTSMATPHVTGLVGLMLSVNPNLHVDEIRDLLRENAVDLGTPGFDQVYGWGRIDAKATLDAVFADTVPPEIVHNGGISTSPFSGYVDPRSDSSDGMTLDQGIDTVFMTFNKPVRDVGSGAGGTLTADAFTITGTGSTNPAIVAIDASANPTIGITLSGPIPVGEWTTIIADVEDQAGNRIRSLGDLGPGQDEPDRLDIGFLPGDINGDGSTVPLDLIRLRSIMAGTYANPVSEVEDFADTNRDGVVSPDDLIAYRRLLGGYAPSTRSWAGATLPPRP